jgi:hypothetical protein
MTIPGSVIALCVASSEPCVPDSRTRSFAQAEVEYLHAVVASYEDVLRLEVAVDDAFLVCRRQSADDLLRVVDRTPERYRPFVQSRTQLFAIEQLGHEERRARVFAGVVNREDVRVIQRRRRTRLLFKAAQAVFVLNHVRRQHLDRYVAAKPLIGGAVNLAHATGTDL